MAAQTDCLRQTVYKRVKCYETGEPFGLEDHSGRHHRTPSPRRQGPAAPDESGPRLLWQMLRIARCGKSAVSQ